MSLIERIGKEFTEAYKNKEMSKKDFLGVIKGEVTRVSKEPSDQDVIAKLKSMIKNNDASYEKTGVSSLSDEELAILNSYLPKQMTESEIDAVIESAIKGGANNIGQIMGAFKGMEADKGMVKVKAEQLLVKG